MLKSGKRWIFVCFVPVMLLWMTVPSFADLRENRKVNPNQSAQGAMIRFYDLGPLAIVSDAFYEFDSTVATALYSNTLDTSVAVEMECVGAPEYCVPENQPPTPPPPQPSDLKTLELVTNIRCVFLDGGTLPISSYPMQVVRSANNGLAIYYYYFTYSLTPIVESVPALTAWNFSGESNPNGTTDVTIQAEIAGQSISKSLKEGTQYSFSLRTSGGKSRVSNLQLLLNRYSARR